MLQNKNAVNANTTKCRLKLRIISDGIANIYIQTT